MAIISNRKEKFQTKTTRKIVVEGEGSGVEWELGIVSLPTHKTTAISNKPEVSRYTKWRQMANNSNINSNSKTSKTITLKATTKQQQQQQCEHKDFNA